MVFRVGDRVMQTRNNYDIEWEREDGRMGTGIFNGDVGVIRAIHPAAEHMEIVFDEKSVDYGFDMLDDLELAYAVTVHKSQGSEYPIIVIPLGSTPSVLLSRNLLYTAVTRAQSMVILVGREEVLRAMIGNARQTLRYTCLTYWLERE